MYVVWVKDRLTNSLLLLCATFFYRRLLSVLVFFFLILPVSVVFIWFNNYNIIILIIIIIFCIVHYVIDSCWKAKKWHVAVSWWIFSFCFLPFVPWHWKPQFLLFLSAVFNSLPHSSCDAWAAFCLFQFYPLYISSYRNRNFWHQTRILKVPQALCCFCLFLWVQTTVQNFFFLFIYHPSGQVNWIKTVFHPVFPSFSIPSLRSAHWSTFKESPSRSFSLQHPMFHTFFYSCCCPLTLSSELLLYFCI